MIKVNTIINLKWTCLFHIRYKISLIGLIEARKIIFHFNTFLFLTLANLPAIVSNWFCMDAMDLNIKFTQYVPKTEIGKASGSLVISQSFSKERVNPLCY